MELPGIKVRIYFNISHLCECIQGYINSLYLDDDEDDTIYDTSVDVEKVKNAYLLSAKDILMDYLNEKVIKYLGDVKIDVEDVGVYESHDYFYFLDIAELRIFIDKDYEIVCNLDNDRDEAERKFIYLLVKKIIEGIEDDYRYNDEFITFDEYIKAICKPRDGYMPFYTYDEILFNKEYYIDFGIRYIWMMDLQPYVMEEFYDKYFD